MNNWISVRDKLPEKNGIYDCIVKVGSINPEEMERKVHFKNYLTGGRFVVFDWTKVLYWKCPIDK